MLQLAPISCSGATSIGSGSTPMTMSWPGTASPSITSAIALALVTVAKGPSRRLEQDSKRLNQKGDSPISGFVFQDADPPAWALQSRRAPGRQGTAGPLTD